MKTVFLAVILFVKLAIVLSYFMHTISSGQFFIIYNPLSAIALSFLFFRVSGDKVKSLFVLVLDICLPIVGIAAITVFLLLRPLYLLFYRNNSIDVYEIPFGDENYEKYNDNKKIELQGNSINIERDAHDVLEILPFREILDGSDPNLKISAIDKLSRQEDRDSIRVLKEALREDEYEVRYFANNALLKIERRLLERVETISEEIRVRSDVIEHYNSRGALYLDIYMLDLLDQDMGKLFLEKSLKDFLMSFSMNSGQKEILSKIVQVNLYLREYEEVLRFSNDALKFDLDDIEKTRILFYMAEASYELGCYQDVTLMSQEILKLNPSYAKINEVSRWWANVEA